MTARPATALRSHHDDWRAQALALDGARVRALAPDFPPQLVTLVNKPPAAGDWLVETKWDGFRLLADLDRGRVRLRSRNNLDWTARLPHVAQAIEALPVASARLDGELVCLDRHGVSDFDALEAALERGDDSRLSYAVFDLVGLQGVDISAAALIERKLLLEALLSGAAPRLIYSRHRIGHAAEAFADALHRDLEGIVCKRPESPYGFTRNRNWIKVKRVLSDEFIVVGYTPPQGSREHFGSLLLAAVDKGELRYVGRVGSGFDHRHLLELSRLLTPLQRDRATVSLPRRVAFRRDAVTRVAPQTVVEVAYHGIAKLGLLRQPSFLRLRTDKSPADMGLVQARRRALCARAKSQSATRIAEVAISHGERPVYPDSGINKADVAAYYAAVSELLLPGVIGRPLSLVRCPEGVGGEQFFQKHHSPALGVHVRGVPITEKDGTRADYICIDDERGLIELVQMNTIEFHVWGAHAAAPDAPDRLIFDLDPAPGIDWTRVVDAARDIRERLQALELRSFVRLTGGKGLHVVAPFRTGPTWGQVKAFCETFAEDLQRAQADAYVATASKAKRGGRIFVDWLRNVRGATSVTGWSLRARRGAPVAMPLHWQELGASTSAHDYDLTTALRRAARLRRDPWADIDAVHQTLPR